MVNIRKMDKNTSRMYSFGPALMMVVRSATYSQRMMTPISTACRRFSLLRASAS